MDLSIEPLIYKTADGKVVEKTKGTLTFYQNQSTLLAQKEGFDPPCRICRLRAGKKPARKAARLRKLRLCCIRPRRRKAAIPSLRSGSNLHPTI